MTPTDHSAPPAPTARPVPTSVSFSIYFLLSLVGCLAAVLVLNLAGNGTNLFPSPGFPPSACMRAWKARRIARLANTAHAPQTLVMGSSRVIPLEEVDVAASTGAPAFNLGVSVGCPVDFLAQLRFVTEAGLRPKHIILGIDELAFGDNPEADFYDMQLVTHTPLFHQLGLRDQLPIIVQILKKTISFTSTKKSVGNLWRRWRHPIHRVPGDTELPESELESMHLHEGDALSEHERRARLTAGIDRLVAFWNKYLDRPDKVDGMRPTRRKVQMFEEFLTLAARRGIHVTVVLLPAHPDFERRTFTPAVLRIRTELGAMLAARCPGTGCTYRDFTELASFGGNPDDFDDGTHMTRGNGRRMLAAIFGKNTASTNDAGTSRRNE